MRKSCAAIAEPNREAGTHADLINEPELWERCEDPIEPWDDLSVRGFGNKGTIDSFCQPLCDGHPLQPPPRQSQQVGVWERCEDASEGERSAAVRTVDPQTVVARFGPMSPASEPPLLCKVGAPSQLGGKEESELRRCRCDGVVRSFSALQEAFGREYSDEDLHEYWRDCCRPVSEERRLLETDQAQATLRHKQYLELLAGRAAEGLENARAVSLGGWCGPKIALRQLNGIDGPSLPWDWGRSSLEHILKMLRTGFAGFLDVEERLETRWASHGMCHPHGVICTTPGHTFWHHDLFDPRDRAALWRRVDRFHELGSFKPLLFIRAVNTTMELAVAVDLLDALQQLFGEHAHLLLLVEWQARSRTILFSDHPSLVVSLMLEGGAPSGSHQSQKYRSYILSALRYARNGVPPEPHEMLASPMELLRAGHPLIRHVSLGEDLTEPMAYEPIRPPSNVQWERTTMQIRAEILNEQLVHANAVEQKTR